MKTKLSIVWLAALLFAGLPLASSSAYVAVSVGIAPPPIPVYEQPLCPGPNYIWTPGYWAYSDVGYYWVPGVWVVAPRVGWYWTPGYWHFRGGRYVFVDGYWGPTIGFYGGINYGFGYYGSGYVGGEWVGTTFRYNTAVTRVDTAVIHNTYVNRSVVRNNTSRASFNGPGGTKAKATAKEQAAAKAEHVGPTSEQQTKAETAKNDPAARAKNKQSTNANRGGVKAEQTTTAKANHSGNTAATGNHGKKQERTAKTEHARTGTTTNHNAQVKKASHQPTVARQPARHPQTMKAPQKTAGRAPANTPEKGKKKKGEKEKPNQQ